MPRVHLGLLAAVSALGAALAAEGEALPASSACARRGSCSGELEDAAGLLQVHKAAANSGSYNILLKAPPAGSLTPVEKISGKCAEGFNAAYMKCLGGTSSYLMHIYTDAKGNAYCGYEGGWAATTDTYPDPSACFASPGHKEALFYDPATKSLLTWGKKVVVGQVAQSNDPSLKCFLPAPKPCKSYVSPKDQRSYIINQEKHVMAVGEDHSFTWSRKTGYVAITTITGGTKQVGMYIKNLNKGDGLSTDVPCAQAGSVEDQAKSFPVKGLSSQCENDNGDYYMLFAEDSITICFPGAPC